jgi:hypothetical protein
MEPRKATEQGGGVSSAVSSRIEKIRRILHQGKDLRDLQEPILDFADHSDWTNFRRSERS